MKKILVVTLLLWSSVAYCGQKAITDTGDIVILNDDGTWVYADQSEQTANAIETNEQIFVKPDDSSFLLKSTKNNSTFWINTDKWVFQKSIDNAEAEYEFQLKGKDLYGMAITEEIAMPVESLAEIALTNAKSVAPDAEIVTQEYRVVNGAKLMYMEINGTIQGIKFAYLGYYYADDAGATQLITYTATNLVAKYRSEIDDFLNGFVAK